MAGDQFKNWQSAVVLVVTDWATRGDYVHSVIAETIQRNIDYDEHIVVDEPICLQCRIY